MSESLKKEIISRMFEARSRGKKFGQMMKIAKEFLAAQPPGLTAEQRRSLLVQAQWVAMHGHTIASLFVPEPGETGSYFMSPQFKAKIGFAAKKQRKAHKEKRLARGLTRAAGSGEPSPTITIRSLPISKPALTKLALGHSRIGGLPDLPQKMSWPTHKGKKIPFVAQLNLAELPKRAQTLLPADGHLLVFALASNDKKHNPTPVSVLFYRGEVDSLKCARRPADSDLWPDWMDTRVYQILPVTLKRCKQPIPQQKDSVGWLFGQVAGEACGEIANRQLQDGDDWINLLAIQSVGSMEWSDSGELYVLIRRSALQKLDFSQVIGDVLGG